jgi:hypothetical protein
MSGYRYISKPSLIVHEPKNGVDSWGFDKFAEWLVDSVYPQFNSDSAGGRAGNRIVVALQDSPRVLRLSEDDWQRLKTAANNPLRLVGGGAQVGLYPTATARTWLPFVDAIDGAGTEPPAPEALHELPEQPAV